MLRVQLLRRRTVRHLEAGGLQPQSVSAPRETTPLRNAHSARIIRAKTSPRGEEDVRRGESEGEEGLLLRT